MGLDVPTKVLIYISRKLCFIPVVFVLHKIIIVIIITGPWVCRIPRFLEPHLPGTDRDVHPTPPVFRRLPWTTQ